MRLHLADRVAAHRERRLHHHAGVAQHFVARVPVQKLVRNVAGDAAGRTEHQSSTRLNLQFRLPMSSVLSPECRRLYLGKFRSVPGPRARVRSIRPGRSPATCACSRLPRRLERLRGTMAKARRHAAALPVGIQVARLARARLPGRRQARQRRRAAGDEGGGRQPRPAPAGASRCRWRCSSVYGAAALLDHAVRRAARRGVRARRAARDPARGARRVPPPAQPVACASTSSARPAA